MIILSWLSSPLSMFLLSSTSLHFSYPHEATPPFSGIWRRERVAFSAFTLAPLGYHAATPTLSCSQPLRGFMTPSLRHSVFADFCSDNCKRGSTCYAGSCLYPHLFGSLLLMGKAGMNHTFLYLEGWMLGNILRCCMLHTVPVFPLG